MSSARVGIALALLLGCGAEAPPTGPGNEPDLAAGGARPKPATSGVTIVDLGFTTALDIDNAGRVVGWRIPSSGPIRSLLWDPVPQQATDLGDLGGGETYALAVNEVLQIAGSSQDATGWRPAVWDAGSWRQLPDAGGPIGAAAEDISDGPGSSGAHWVVGEVSGWQAPVIWSVSGTGTGFNADGPVLLPIPAGGSGLAFGVNSNGLVAGVFSVAGSSAPLPAAWTTDNATSWQRTALLLSAGETGGEAYDVNAVGTIVGRSYKTGRPCDHGLVWAGPSLSPTLLPDLAGGTCSWPYAINHAGHITGLAHDAHRRQQAVLWIPQQGGGYSIRALGKLKAASSSVARGLNEPRTDAQGTKAVEVVGYSLGNTQKATLWRVTIP